MIFIDAGYFVALFSPRDQWNSRALAWARNRNDKLLVTEYVLNEAINALCESASRPRAYALIETVYASPNISIVRANQELWTEGLTAFARYADKSWSLTDCISFNVMKANGITQALAHDHHFEQAGFEALLRRDP